MYNDDADHLDSFLDDLEQSSRHSRNDLTSEITAAAASIHSRDHTDTDANPRTGFLAHLEEQLDMRTPELVLHLPPRPFARESRRTPAMIAKPPLIRSLHHHAVGSLATAALLIITSIGVYLAMFAPSSNQGSNPTVPASSFATDPDASPTAGSHLCFPYLGTYLGCLQRADLVGSNHVSATNYDAVALAARSVQLQGWAIAPENSISGVDNRGGARGIVVDFVIAGTYVATFDVPVVVHPGGWTNNGIQYLDPGVIVELSRGDSVSYQLGGMVEIRNPLSVQRLEFKRAVIYQGDVSAFSSTTDGVTTRAEADGSLPAEFVLSNAAIDLLYVNLYPGEPFPIERPDSVGTIIGPTDPQRGPAGTEGFVLAIRTSMG